MLVTVAKRRRKCAAPVALCRRRRWVRRREQLLEVDERVGQEPVHLDETPVQVGGFFEQCARLLDRLGKAHDRVRDLTFGERLRSIAHAASMAAASDAARYPCVALNVWMVVRALANVRAPRQTPRLSFVSNGSETRDSERGSGQRFRGFLGAPPSSSGIRWSSSYPDGSPVSPYNDICRRMSVFV